jgi:hypothetical protein
VIVARSPFKSCGYDGTVEQWFFIVSIFIAGIVDSWCS